MDGRKVGTRFRHFQNKPQPQEPRGGGRTRTQTLCTEEEEEELAQSNLSLFAAPKLSLLDDALFQTIYTTVIDSG